MTVHVYVLSKYLLVHEFVESVIKVSPHVGVEMNSSNTFRMRWRRNIVGQNESPGQAVEKDILDLEELANAVACSTQSP